MSLENIIHTKGEWLLGDGPDSDIVLSSRIRLARNLKGVPFPNAGDYTSNNEVLQKVSKVLRKIEFFKNGFISPLRDLSDWKNKYCLRGILSAKSTLLVDSRVALPSVKSRICLS